MTATDQAVGAPERLHPLYLLTGLGPRIRQMVGGSAAMGYFAATGKGNLAIWMLAAMLVAMVGGVLLTWLRFGYRVGDGEIRIDSGIIRRTHRSIPFDRIQDVDISQGPLARMLGLARVEFETGGSAGGEQDDGALAAISLGRAQALRDQVRQRRGSSVEAETAAQAAPPLFAMDRRRVLTAGLFNFSLAVLAGLFGATQTLGDAAGFDLFARRFWRKALDAGSPIADYILAHQLAAAIAGAAVLILVGIVTGVGRTLLREHGFRLDRVENGLRRRRGLLTLTDVTIPIRRAQAAIVGSGPVRARFGWKSLKLQSLGRDGAKTGDHAVAPLATEEEIETILRELGWDQLAADGDWHGVSPAYGLGMTIVAGALLIPVALLALFEPLAALAAATLLSIAVAARWLAWKRYRYAVDGSRLLVASGWWCRKLVILPMANIQSIDLVENFLGRRLGIAALKIGVASGRGYSDHGIAALPVETARRLRFTLLTSFE